MHINITWQQNIIQNAQSLSGVSQNGSDLLDSGVGSLTANPDLIERLATAPPNILGSNIVAQKGAVAGLKTKSEWFPNVLASIRENQRLIRDAVSDIPGLSLPIYPSNGNFLIVECAAAGIRPEAICELMYQQKIMVRQGAYHTSKFGDQFIKVSVSAPREVGRKVL